MPNDHSARQYHVDAAKYQEMYAASVADPEAFWAEQGKRIDWIKPYSQVKDVSFAPGDIHIKWYHDGTLNVSANCIDRHLETRGDQTAIIWEPDDPEEPAQHISYRELHANTCKMANVLTDLGVTKGDRVVIYLPMIPEAAYAMLACARIGAIHSIVFAGFSPDALGARVNGCDAKVVITADEAPRGGRKTALKSNADAALAQWRVCLPLINHENRQCGLRAAKTVMQAGGVLGSDHVRHPLKPMTDRTRARLLQLAAESDVIALRWGK